MAPRDLARIGAQLRKVPGLTPILDARMVARRWRHDRALERGAAEGDAEQLRLLAAHGDLKLNVGSGTGILPGWVNVDINTLDSADVLYMDATARWPLPDGCAQAINSEHFIEHISLDQAAEYLREAYRTLAPGGVIRTSTPSLRGTVDAYLQADPSVLEAHRARGYAARNHAELINNYFFEWGHRHIYDGESLAQMLAEVGFVNATPAVFGESDHPLLRGIDTHDMAELRSLAVAVDAIKP